MARNGSGSYSLPAGNPVVTGQTISSTVHNNTMSDLSAEMTNSVAKDGQTTMTGALKMGSQKITGLASGTVRTDGITFGQAQDNAGRYVAAGGSANAITLTLSPAITAYASGQKFSFRATATNTGVMTAAVNGLATKDLVLSDGTAMPVGAIQSGGLYDCMYSATTDDFHLLSVHDDLALKSESNTFTATTTFSDNVTVTGTLTAGTISGIVNYSSVNWPQAVTNATDVDHDVDFTAGSGSSSDGTVSWSTIALTKQFDTAFAAGTGAGGLGDTVSLPTSGTLHIFVIQEDATPTNFDLYGDTDLAASNAPSGWTMMQRIMSLPTDSSANLRAFRQNGRNFMLQAPFNVYSTTPSTTASNITSGAPKDIEVTLKLQLNYGASNNTYNIAIIVQCPNDAAIVPTVTNATITCSAITNVFVQIAATYTEVVSNTSAEFALDASGALGTLNIHTLGWYDKGGT
jgi:hypothetical protein